eukprot:6082041-Amphidinium_carterae.1
MQCSPKVRAHALVERRVSGHPAKSESLQATTVLGVLCLGQYQTTSGASIVNRTALFSILQCLTVGEESPLDTSLAVN